MDQTEDILPGNDIRVSVLIISYNTCALTLDAIGSAYDSLVDPSFHIEVIVLDNASSDGSADAVRAKFPGVRVLALQENIGFGRGNNAAAEYASGQMLLLLNSDTVVRKGAIETMYRAIISDPNIGVVGPFLENPDGSYQGSMMSFPTVWRTFCFCFWLDRIFRRWPLFADAYMLHADTQLEQCVDVIVGAALMIRRDLYARLEGFDPVFFFYCEECDLCKRSNDAGYQSLYLPSAHVMHYMGGSTRTRPWWVYRLLRTAWITYARKHDGKFAAFLTMIIVHAAYAVRIPSYYIIGLFAPRLRELGRSMLNSYLRNDVPVRASETKPLTGS